MVEVIDRRGLDGSGTRGSRSAGGAGGEASTLGLQELEVFPDHAQLAALLPRLFVFPGVELEAAVDEERRAFAETELLQELGLLPPEGDVDEGDLFALFTVGGGVAAIDRQTEVGESGGSSLTDFRLAGEVSEEGDFVVASHGDLGLS